MVDDGGAAGVDGFEEGDEGRIADGLGIEGEVELPPHALEDFNEVAGGFARRGEAAGEGGIEMVVGVDEARHGDHALGIDHLRADGHLDGRADGGNLGTFDEDFALGENGAGIVEGDDQGVFDQQGGHGASGSDFSTLWKNVFHTMENFLALFPRNGKVFRGGAGGPRFGARPQPEGWTTNEACM